MATENYTVTQLYENADVEYSPSLGRHTSGKLKFKVAGADSEEQALLYATEKIPKAYLRMDLRRLNVESRLTSNVWVVGASYEYRTNRISISTNNLPEEVIRYTLSTTTATVKFSRKTQGKYANSGVPTPIPDYNGAINVQDGRPQGCEIKIPVLGMQITHYWKKSTFTTNLRNSILLHGSYINSSEFRGFPERTLLFTGADIQEVDNGDRKLVQVDFQFEISNNENDVEVEGWHGGPIQKAGWDYLWIDYREIIAGRGTTTYPAYAYTERVYPACDFSTRLGLSNH
ncbi:MAG: hypothetical protein IJJ33_15830 [Victivallales bacterium]|nr:hypothetical protein [Victivallales bacterium]